MEYNEAYENFLKAKKQLEEAKAVKYKQFLDTLQDGTIATYDGNLVVLNQVKLRGRTWMAFPILVTIDRYSKTRDFIEIDGDNFTYIELLDKDSIISHIQRKGKKLAENFDSELRGRRY